MTIDEQFEALATQYVAFAMEHLGITPKQNLEALEPLKIYFAFPNLSFEEQNLIVVLYWRNRGLTFGVNTERVQLPADKRDEFERSVTAIEQAFMEAKDLVMQSDIPNKITEFQKQLLADWFNIQFS